MYSKHPNLAHEMEEKTPKGKKLPKHVENQERLKALKKMLKK